MNIVKMKNKMGKFKQESSQLIEFILNDLDIFNLLKGCDVVIDSKKSAFFSLKKKILSDLKDADTFAKNQFENKIIERVVEEIKNPADLPNMHFISNSKYGDKKSLAFIKKNAKGVVTYKFTDGRRKYSFSFIIFDEKFRKLDTFDLHAYKVVMWLYMASQYAGDSCAETLNISLFFADVEKMKPSSPLDILSAENCNTAVTTSCTKEGIIFLYRQEEWFKVLIHESFHIFGLDFSYQFSHVLNQRMSEVFPIQSTWNIFECYTEFWAEILNVMFVSYLVIDADNSSVDFDTFSNYVGFLFEIERCFSIFQVSKILDFMGLKLMDLHHKNTKENASKKYLYRENTNVFSYYILKMILFFNCDETLEWFEKHNQNILKFSSKRKDVEDFGDFLIKKFVDPSLHRTMLAMYKKYPQVTSLVSEFTNNTLRMTAVELLQ